MKWTCFNSKWIFSISHNMDLCNGVLECQIMIVLSESESLRPHALELGLCCSQLHLAIKQWQQYHSDRASCEHHFHHKLWSPELRQKSTTNVGHDGAGDNHGWWPCIHGSKPLILMCHFCCWAGFCCPMEVRKDNRAQQVISKRYVDCKWWQSGWATASTFRSCIAECKQSLLLACTDTTQRSTEGAQSPKTLIGNPAVPA